LGVATLGCLVTLGWAAAMVRTPHLLVPTVALHQPPNDADSWPEWIARVAPRWESREVLLNAEGEYISVARSGLGYVVDRTALLASLQEGSASLTPMQRWQRRLSTLFKLPLPPKDLPIPWTFDPERARTTLSSLSTELERSPIDAHLDFARRQLRHEKPGRRLNLSASFAELAALGPQPGAPVALRFDEMPASTTLSDLPNVDPRKLLASFETDFSKKRGPRIHNIRQAAHYLDGSVLLPGATLSFNKSVGPRVAKRGFIDAPVIVNDVMESGMGGGVSQVATTLDAAAIYGGLEITERRSHSRPSGYAPLGLDATVIDDVQDLKIKNPYSVPLYVRA